MAKSKKNTISLLLDDKTVSHVSRIKGITKSEYIRMLILHDMLHKRSDIELQKMYAEALAYEKFGIADSIPEATYNNVASDDEDEIENDEIPEIKNDKNQNHEMLESSNATTKRQRPKLS